MIVERVRNLLDPSEADALRAAALALEARFVDASIEGAREDWRVASVIYDPPPAAQRVAEHVRSIALGVAALMSVQLEEIAEIECQLTVSGDGGVYKRHSDSRGPDAQKRMLSYVHYFMPTGDKRFEGGELWLHDGDRCEIIVPEDNLTVLFPSHLEHEIRPVRVATGAFAHGRFTVNGWVWRR